MAKRRKFAVQRKSGKKYMPVRFPPNFEERKRKGTLPKSWFTGRYRRNDYKQVWHEGRSQGAHVVKWKKKHGNRSIPKGYVVDHIRGNKRDSNPHVRGLRLMQRNDHAKHSGSQRYNPVTDRHYGSEETNTA